MNYKFIAECKCGKNAVELEGAIEKEILRHSDDHDDGCNGEYSRVVRIEVDE